MTAPLLGLLGLVLSVAVPRALAGARWPARAPAAAVLLWQAVTLASVLSAVGVVLAAPEQIVRANDAGRAVAVTVLVATLAVATLIVLRLLVSFALVMRSSRRRRERHRLLADLLDRAQLHGGLPDLKELRVLDGAVPFAYCLPGRSPRVVVSDGTLKVLAPEQVAAVLAHEQGHLARRHDLVLESFVALYRALPGRLRSRRSLEAVGLLLEMLADDAARRRGSDRALREALVAMAPTWAEPGTEPRDPERERRARLARLGPGALPPSPLISVVAGVAAVAVLVLPTVVVVVPWLTRALPMMPL